MQISSFVSKLLISSKEGSSDVAYAICILAKTSNPGVSDTARVELESSPCRGIDRLRSAENELRKARILVALDKARGELFTFYRKEDLQRDAKSIFNRVATILRKNECQMSSKNAIKTFDLLRPDLGKLHRLFVYAILCMVKSVVKQCENLIPLDLNTFLFRTTLSSHEIGCKREFGDYWRLLDFDAQLLPNGQVTVTNLQDNLISFKQVSSIGHNSISSAYLGKPNKVLLALTGQYARYAGGYIGKLPFSVETTGLAATTSDRTTQAILEDFRQQIWKTSVEQWLAENEFDFSIGGNEWIEIEIPLCEANDENPKSPQDFAERGKIIWKPIFWPTSLCYVNTVDQSFREGAESSPNCFEDPLQFAEEWIASAPDRADSLRQMEQDMEMAVKHERVEDLEMSNYNNIHVDAGQVFRRVTSIEGQGVTTIYPTPPDGALSQVTPGVFSVDGLTTTPGDGTVAVHVDKTDNNVEMMDLTGGQVAIGSGLYDEDLFEDVPGEKFGESEMADEPNWDFFDEPDAEMMENADEMELDIPEKASPAIAEDWTLTRSEIKHEANESTDLLPEDHSRVKSPQADKAPVSAFTSRADDGVPHLLEARSTAADLLITRQADPMSQPLSPVEVRKKLFPDMASPSVYQIGQAHQVRPIRRSFLKSHFDSNSFQSQLKVADSRYSANGFFWFEPKREKTSDIGLTEQHLDLPRIGIPKKEWGALGPTSPDSSEPPRSSSAEDTDFDSSDFFSESNKPGSHNGSIRDEADSLAVSPWPVDDVLDSDTKTRIQGEVLELLELLRPEITEQSIERMHRPLQRPSRPSLPIGCNKSVTVAQVIVDQVSQSFFQYDQHDRSLSESEARNLDLFQPLRSIYGDATELDLAKLAEICTNTSDAREGSGLEGCPSPLIRLARADANVSALPTIQPFWETLGLQPVSGRKNITAFCIHPLVSHLAEGCSAFLLRFSEIYSNCNLGSHTIGHLQDMTTNGLIEWDVRKESSMNKLLTICERLGSSLTATPPSAENIVVYIINPFESRTAVADICNAFVTLFSNYAKACGKSKGSELNLQIMPMSFIASSDTLVIPSQAEYLSLALEVYNRCPPTNSSGAVAESGAAVTLAEPVPKNITFNLASDATSPLSKDGEILHLAYSQSVDQRWITACWTDNLGRTALTMTYCLREKGSSASRGRSEVIREMWEVSEDIMIMSRGKWRLSIAHDGPLEPDEINEWSFLANQNESNTNLSHCALTLLTFNQHPSIQFQPPTPQTKPQPPASAATIAIAAMATSKYGTPASTPSATPAVPTSSPEQLTAPTPGASALLTAPTPPDQFSQSQPNGFDITTDPDATLLHNPTDEFWTLILSFGLNNSPSPLESRPALLSGFLLKRRGTLDSEGLVSLGVNLIFSPGPAGEQKALLREVIEQWRGLYTLGRTKSLGGEGDVLPWHVRTAVRGCRAVAEVL